MTEPHPAAASHGRLSRRFQLPPVTVAALIAAAIVVVAIAAFAYRSMAGSAVLADRVAHTIDVIEHLQTLVEHVKDAETGQRGYLLTGTENYLARHTTTQTTWPTELATLRNLTSDNPRQASRLASLAPLLEAKMSELRETVTLRRSGDIDGALAIVRTDRGKVTMDAIRSLVTDMQTDERGLLAERQRDADESLHNGFLITIAGTAVLLALIALAAWQLARSHRERETESWLRAGAAGMAEQLLGEKRVDVLCDKALAYLARYLDVPLATLYATDAEGDLSRIAVYASGMHMVETPERIAVGQGLLGQAAKDKRPLHVRRIPDDYAHVESALGRAAPRELLIAPAAVDGVVHAVAEFAFLRPVEAEDRELLARLSEVIAVAIRSSRERERIDQLLAETQQQAEEMQTQQEELRVSNEELEEQSHALKASQTLLEGQQAELEQTNSQLEEQTQMLEAQKDEMARAAAVLAEKAEELARSNQYKSEFLANMSHELRTPLNSTLILSKLLADNKQGNLTPEQVRFADTISSAGNDLLTLINDILDLSKIEAGKVEVTVESVPVARVVEALVKTFDPIAKDKGLAFAVTVEPGSAERIDTDPQRLAQILRNLLSNAFKFTEKGEVGLRVFAAGDDALAMAVSDSGIGVAPHEQQVIFEAFRQADGSTHRRFGGTGLGLSISRDLARLLGGDITVHSKPGEGSVFTVTLPVSGAQPGMPPRPVSVPVPAIPAAVAPRVDERPAPAVVPHDDRHTLAANARVILVIEDDKRFAAILRDLAHEMGFQCIVAHSAGEGIAAATTFRPSAILLDMNLPDQSGLGVLDQLKRNPETRHIPVHVASVADYSQEAREAGRGRLRPEAGRARETGRGDREAACALHAARAPRARRRGRSQRQLDSIRQLLENDDVQIVGATRAADALAHLQVGHLRLHGDGPEPARPVGLRPARTAGRARGPRVPAGHRLHRPVADARRGAAAAALLAVDHHQGRALARTPARRGHAVPAPGRGRPAARAPAHAARSAQPRIDLRGPLRAGGGGRRAQRVRAQQRARAEGPVDRDRAQRPRSAGRAREEHDRSGRDDRPRADGHHDAGDGRLHRDARDPQGRTRWKKLPIIALTAKAMRDDQEKCLAAGANDYVAKPLDVEKLLSLMRVWMPK